MPAPPRLLVGERLHWSYAGLAMAHAAVSRGDAWYGPLHYGIRSKLYKRLRAGELAIGPLADDERLKLVLPQACAYCGGRESLACDHVIPRHRGGPDVGDNLVWSCSTCNSSKGTRDLLGWYEERGEFVPLLLLRRWLKLALDATESAGAMATQYDAAPPLSIEVARAPRDYPAPSTLRLWVVPF